MWPCTSYVSLAHPLKPFWPWSTTLPTLSEIEISHTSIPSLQSTSSDSEPNFHCELWRYLFLKRIQLCSQGRNATPGCHWSTDKFSRDTTFIFLPRSTLWMPFQHSRQWAGWMFEHSEHCPSPLACSHCTAQHGRAVPANKGPISANHYTWDTAYTRCCSEPFVNPLVFPNRHTASIHQAALCGRRVWHMVQAKPGRAHPVLFPLYWGKARELCQVSRCLIEKGSSTQLSHL